MGCDAWNGGSHYATIRNTSLRTTTPQEAEKKGKGTGPLWHFWVTESDWPWSCPLLINSLISLSKLGLSFPGLVAECILIQMGITLAPTSHRKKLVTGEGGLHAQSHTAAVWILGLSYTKGHLGSHSLVHPIWGTLCTSGHTWDYHVVKACSYSQCCLKEAVETLVWVSHKKR